MKERKPEYRLQLQNRWTDDVDELVAECDLIRTALEKYDLKVIGYDPGVLVYDGLADPRMTGKSVDIPVWLLKRLIEKDEEKNRLREAIGIVCEGWTLPDPARKVLETALWGK